MDTNPIINSPVADHETLAAVDHLNVLLRGELSALETYRIALSNVKFNGAVMGELRTCEQSHRERESVLRKRVVDLGGDAAKTSGAWGVFAKMMEEGAAGLGIGAALVVLAEGEAHGFRSYEKHMAALDASLRAFVQTALFPKQQATTLILERLRLGTG
jgi:hypothetical protein